MSAMTQLATRTPSTAHGTILGTVQYMAPEQVEGKEADARSDILALGAVIYEMVTGTRPFKGDTPASIIGAILRDDPPRCFDGPAARAANVEPYRDALPRERSRRSVAVSTRSANSDWLDR